MVKRVIRFLIHIMNCIIPKNPEFIYLRSSFIYPDNIQAILDKMLEYHVDKKYFIFCEGKGFEKYHEENIRFLSEHTIKAFWIFLRSKYVFWDIGLYLNSKPVKRQITVNVFHGVGFKKIGFYNIPEVKPYPTSKYVVTVSDLYAEKMSYAFGVKRENALITGNPRNDYLYRPISDAQLSSLGIRKRQEEKIVIWMPTYRKSKYTFENDGREYEFGFPFLNPNNLKQLNQRCSSYNIICVLKWHGMQPIPDISDEELNNIVFLTSEKLRDCQIGLNQLLARCDALVTDYSSVYTDYMLLNRPICFAYDDIDYYRRKRGFMFDDVEALMPGKRVNNFEALLEFLYEVSQNKDDYIVNRKILFPLLNRYEDNLNSLRILKRVSILK